jgi:hypothetical protein
VEDTRTLTCHRHNHRGDGEASSQPLLCLCFPYLVLVIDTVYDVVMETFFEGAVVKNSLPRRRSHLRQERGARHPSQPCLLRRRRVQVVLGDSDCLATVTEGCE